MNNITDHDFNHGCMKSCTRDHSQNCCQHRDSNYKLCGHKESEHVVACGKGTLYPLTCSMLHEDDCDCSACVEKIMEERHEWDYDNKQDMQTV